MKINAIILLSLLFCSYNAAAFQLTGKIGNYPIEMEIETVSWETGELDGKYRYTHKDSYLDIEGEILQDIVWIEESYKGEVTGTFYLELVENALEGKWVAGSTWFPVNLELSNRDKFNTKTLDDYSKDVNADISGGYAIEDYFLNDMWFRDDNPQMEIGFNGGGLVVEEMGADSLKFTVNVICGPTYHIAYASGMAYQSSENVYDCLLEAYDGDTCYITLEKSLKSFHVKASYGFACGFGARAYLDHTFIKITDRYKFDGEEEVSLSEMKGKE
jgi:hypothetical protein